MTIHPLLRLVVSEPQLVGDHLHGYLNLLQAELAKMSDSLLARMGLLAGAAAAALLGVLLVGVALLLRASVPPDDYPAGWALVVVPLVPLVAAVVMVLIARAKPAGNGLEMIKRQIGADAAMLREAGAP